MLILVSLLLYVLSNFVVIVFKFLIISIKVCKQAKEIPFMNEWMILMYFWPYCIGINYSKSSSKRLQQHAKWTFTYAIQSGSINTHHWDKNWKKDCFVIKWWPGLQKIKYNNLYIKLHFSPIVLFCGRWAAPTNDENDANHQWLRKIKL